MKRIIYIGLAASALLALASCSNNLDEKVYSSLTESSYSYSASDAQKVVGACYYPLRSYISHTGLYGLDVASSDEIVMPPNSTGWDDGGIYRRVHYHTWNSEQVHIANSWNPTYRGIIFCNTAIKQFNDGVIPVDDATKASCIAELRALRAFYYSIVLDFWGDAPLITEPTTELPAKTDRATIYDFVVSELKEVTPNLSEVQGGISYSHMNKWAALTTLARVYINAEIYTGSAHWQDCLDACNQIINSGKLALSDDYRAPFREDVESITSNPEVIFTIPFDESKAGGNYIQHFSWGAPLKYRFNVGFTPWGSGSAMGIPQFINTYDPDDERLGYTWIMGPQYKYESNEPIMCAYDFPGEQLNYVNRVKSGNFTMENEGYRMLKYEVKVGSTSSSSTDIPVFRYSEVLMMKAECLLRLGQAGAGDLVTQVRRRAFKAHPEKAVVTDSQLKENSSYQYGYYVSDYGEEIDRGNTDPVKFGRLYDEYGWEFAWEMGVRSRMIRFGTYTTKSWLSHQPQGDYRALFPIPESALTPNPKLEQNPNYK